MNYNEVAKKVLELVGGESNVDMVGHCITRLRFVLKDTKKAKPEEIKKIKGIMGVIDKGGQFQVVIGGEVTDVYRELMKLGDFSKVEISEEEQKEAVSMDAGKKEDKSIKGVLSKVLETIAGIFFPIIPALVGTGMLKALLSVLRIFKLIDVDSQTYQIINMISDTAFYFLPVVISISASKKFKTNPYLAAVLAGTLLHPNFVAMMNKAKEAGEGISFIGLPVTITNYAYSVIPIILAVWFMSFVEPRVEKIVPKSLRMMLSPVIILLIVAPVMLIVIGPLGNILGGYFGSFVVMLNDFAPWLIPTLVGALSPLLVMVGMHYGLIPIGINMLATSGYDIVTGPGMTVSNIAQGGASLAVALKAKNKEIKSLAASVGITAVCGITEPAMYGISLRYKKPLIAAMIGGGVGGLFMGIMGVKRYVQVAPGLFALPAFIGGESMHNFYMACVGAALSFIVSFVLSYLFGIEEDK